MYRLIARFLFQNRSIIFIKPPPLSRQIQNIIFKEEQKTRRSERFCVLLYQMCFHEILTTVWREKMDSLLKLLLWKRSS